MSDDRPELPPSLSLLDELAKKRRELAQTESTRRWPDFVDSIDRTEVRYIFRPQDLPFAQVDVALFVRLMHDNYQTRLDEPNISQLLGDVPREKLLSLSEAEVWELVFRISSRKQIEFEGGKFPLKFDFVPIISISMDFESIQVTVAGVSEVAETVAQETLQLLWSAAGSNRNWDSIARTRRQVSYGTDVRLKLPFPAERLLSQDVRRFFDDHCINGERLIAKMTALSVRDDFKPSKSISGVVNLEEVVFRISLFDSMTGRPSSQNIRFLVTALDDYGTGIIKAISTLRLDDHLTLISLLLEELGQGVSTE